MALHLQSHATLSHPGVDIWRFTLWLQWFVYFSSTRCSDHLQNKALDERQTKNYGELCLAVGKGQQIARSFPTVAASAVGTIKNIPWFSPSEMDSDTLRILIEKHWISTFEKASFLCLDIAGLEQPCNHGVSGSTAPDPIQTPGTFFGPPGVESGSL